MTLGELGYVLTMDEAPAHDDGKDLGDQDNPVLPLQDAQYRDAYIETQRDKDGANQGGDGSADDDVNLV